MKNSKTKKMKNLMGNEEKAVHAQERRYHALELGVLRGTRQRKPRAVSKPATGTQKAGEQKAAFEELMKKQKQKLAGGGVGPAQLAAPAIPPVCFSVAAPDVAAGVESKVQMAPLAATGIASASILETGNHFVDAMMSGYASSNDRMPDPYTCVKTFTTNCHYADVLTPLMPTTDTTYGGKAFLLMGSGVGTMGFPNHTAAASDVNITYDSISGGSVGINTAAFVSRPVGINQTITFLGVGPVHKVTVTALPILPDNITALSSSMAGWPASLSSGLTTLQSTWGGRQWQVEPGESLTFVCSPLDNRGFDFEQSTIIRGKYDALGQLAWSGWLVWVWGMTAGDKLARKIVVGEECAHITSGTTMYPYPQSRNPPDPQVATRAKDLFSNLMEKGLGAFKYASDTVFPMASRIWSAIGNSAKGYNGDTQPTGFMAAAALSLVRKYPASFQRLNSVECKDIDDCALPSICDATKTANALTDAPELVTPRGARRPSLALSLTTKKR